VKTRRVSRREQSVVLNASKNLKTIGFSNKKEVDESSFNGVLWGGSQTVVH
jgi:hypothetical protein